MRYRKGYWESIGFKYVSLRTCSLRNEGFMYFECISRNASNRLSPMGYMYRRKRLRNDDWVVEDEKLNEYRLDNRTFSYIGSIAFKDMISYG